MLQEPGWWKHAEILYATSVEVRSADIFNILAWRGNLLMSASATFGGSGSYAGALLPMWWLPDFQSWAIKIEILFGCGFT